MEGVDSYGQTHPGVHDRVGMCPPQWCVPLEEIGTRPRGPEAAYPSGLPGFRMGCSWWVSSPAIAVLLVGHR